MITNLADYFNPEQEIFLEGINYKRLENINSLSSKEISLLCQDTVNASSNQQTLRILITRTISVEPKMLFELSITFGAILTFNENSRDIDWEKINLAEELKENGAFITNQLVSRISLLIGQITSSFGQQPLLLPPTLVK